MVRENLQNNETLNNNTTIIKNCYSLWGNTIKKSIETDMCSSK